jgi:hypothetical protein
MKALLGVCAIAACAGSALADISSINSLQLNAYECFRNPLEVKPSSLTLNGGAPVPVVFNSTLPGGPIAGSHVVREVYPQFTPGFANRHMLWFSNNNGATAYQLQAGESFRIRACFTTRTNHATGIGAPFNSETGIWIHAPRVNDEGQNYIDEGGVWLITNGTSFAGGITQDFTLFGEGGFNNPNSPPIYFPGDVVEVDYIYHAPGALGPGSGAKYEASVYNVTRNIFVQSGVKNVALPLTPGTTLGFRFQNQIDPAISTDTTHDAFNISIAIPAPGAMTLLGLGGLIATRRRR